MFLKGAFLATLVILEVVHSLPVEDKIDPVELFYHCVDPEQGEHEPAKSPVLLIHPILGTHRSYEGMDQLIADRTQRRVCAVDLRNHGDSPWNNRSDIAALAADIGHFLDKQNIKKVNILGHSLGGKTAIHYTLTNPDRVESLVVEDMRPNNIKRSTFKFVKLLARLIKGILESQPAGLNEKEAMEFTNQNVRSLSKQVNSYEKIPYDMSRYLTLHFTDNRWQLKHNVELLLDKMDYPDEMWTKSVGLYTGPALFIYGTESFFQVGDDDEILKLFPNAKFVPFEGVGHIIHEHYHEFDEIVIKFLNEIN